MHSTFWSQGKLVEGVAEVSVVQKYVNNEQQAIEVI